jgi:hypothetical protein
MVIDRGREHTTTNTSEAYERMWLRVGEKEMSGILGILRNDSGIEDNDTDVSAMECDVEKCYVWME